MIVLKAVNWADADKEYDYISSVPPDENGFINEYFGLPREAFPEQCLKKLINNAAGKDLPPEQVM